MSTPTQPSKPPSNPTLGFIGLGIMGRPMALRLLQAGYRVQVHSRREIPSDLQQAGAQPCVSAQAVAKTADVVITMLPDTPDVEQVLFGPAGVAEGLRPGTLVIDMSSISPMASQGFAQRLEALGCSCLDAPVSGGEIGAQAGTLTIMVGGRTEVFARALPLFQAMGKAITHVGDHGAGQITKVANQIIVALNIAAVAEALVFASKAGADPSRVRQALMGGFAASRVLEVHGERMLQRRFAPGFRIGLHQKDLNLALQGARSLGMALPQTAGAAQLMQACTAQGWADMDHSALVTALELMAAHSLPSPQA
ncbi:MAG: 2-hydroxy-3-oxopropionate reductase [Rubrivivax sp.]|jgi:2-hydroxy-3-oxopropionate reductase|nr:2-hydroxy-3-oxopropionate reductase [Rubrivivax sp.]